MVHTESSQGADHRNVQTRGVRSICRCCSALCGIVVELEGDTVVSVRGDKENARSQGYVCPKGVSLPQLHHHPDNLMVPRFKNGATDWAAGLDDIAARLRAVIDKYGSDAVAVYQGNGCVADGLARGGLIARFMASFGSSQFYSAASIDVMPALRAAEMVCGSAELLPIWRDDEPESRFVIFWGVNPLVSHGYVTMFPNPVNRIAAFRKRGGKVWVVDPRATKASAVADHHLAIRPGADAVLLAWLIRELLDNGADTEDMERTTTEEDRARLTAAVAPFTRDVAVAATGLPADDLDNLLAQIRAAGRIAIVGGTGINFGRHALVTDWLRWILLVVTGSLDRRGGMWFSPGWLNPLEARPEWPATPPEGWVEPGTKSRPDLPRVMAQNATIGIVDEIEAGNIRALIIAGANPLLSFPEPARIEKAMKSLDTLMVIDVLETSFTRLATDVLAAAGQLERTDVLTETFTTMSVPAIVPPLGERRYLWWMLAQLARRLGGDIVNGENPDTLTEDTMLRSIARTAREGGADALIAAGADGKAAPVIYGWVRDKALISGRWRLVPPGLAERLPAIRDEVMVRGRGADELLLVSGRHLTRVNATRYVTDRKTRDLPRIHLHPNDAEKRQLRNGDHVAMRSENGRMVAILEVDAIVREGVVWMSHGWLDNNVGNLTSAVTGVDPLTGQPEMTAIVVTLDRAA